MRQILLLVLAALPLPALAWHAHPRPVDARQAAQSARIADGVTHGQLTRCEAARLDARTARVAHREAVYRASGGLSPRERADLERRLDAVSRDIAEQRRDGNGCR